MAAEIVTTIALTLVFGGIIYNGIRITKLIQPLLTHTKPCSIFSGLQPPSQEQWRNFVNNLPWLMVLASVGAIGWIIRRYCTKAMRRNRRQRPSLPTTTTRHDHVVRHPTTNRQPEASCARRLYHCVLGIVVACIMHGNDVVLLIGVILLSHSITQCCLRTPSVHWTVMLLLLLLTGNLSPFGLWSAVTLNDGHSGLNALGLHGLLSFTGTFRLTFLRLISYNMDTYYALSTVSIRSPENTNDAYSQRQNTSLEIKAYSLLNALNYVMYPPLYFAGPIASFNAFTSQLARPQYTVTFVSWISHVIRLVICLLLQTWLQCYASVSSSLYSDRPAFIAVVGGHSLNAFSAAILVLIDMYLRYLIIWRFARLVALLDDVDVVDNMLHCFAASPSFVTFWRSWHASFNVWIVRYLYVPLGGSRRKMILVWIVFIFVGVWHVTGWHLVVWAIANALGFSLEIILRPRLPTLVADILALFGLVFANVFILGFWQAQFLLSTAFFSSSSPSETLSTILLAIVLFALISRVNTIHQRRVRLNRKRPQRTHPQHVFDCQWFVWYDKLT